MRYCYVYADAFILLTLQIALDLRESRMKVVGSFWEGGRQHFEEIGVGVGVEGCISTGEEGLYGDVENDGLLSRLLMQVFALSAIVSHVRCAQTTS